MGFLFGEFFGAALKDNLAAVESGFRADLNDVVGILNDIGLVLNYEEGIADVNEAVEDREELLNIGEMKAGGRLIQDEQGVDAAGGGGQELAEFESLGFAAGQGVERLTQAQISKAGFHQRLKGLAGFGEKEVFLVGDSFDCFKECQSFGCGHPEEIDDRFIVIAE